MSKKILTNKINKFLKIKNLSLKVLRSKYQKVRIKTKIRNSKKNLQIKFQTKIKNKLNLSSKK